MYQLQLNSIQYITLPWYHQFIKKIKRFYVIEAHKYKKFLKNLEKYNFNHNKLIILFEETLKIENSKFKIYISYL